MVFQLIQSFGAFPVSQVVCWERMELACSVSRTAEKLGECWENGKLRLANEETSQESKGKQEGESKEAKSSGEQEAPVHASIQLEQVAAWSRVPGLSDGMGP